MWRSRLHKELGIPLGDSYWFVAQAAASRRAAKSQRPTSRRLALAIGRFVWTLVFWGSLIFLSIRWFGVPQAGLAVVLALIPCVLLNLFWSSRKMDTHTYHTLREGGHNVCPKCGYLRTGLEDTATCPECGRALAQSTEPTN